MAKELNYQIPRSPVDVVNMINEFIDFATQLKKDIEECEEDQE
jgi:hypothetical protein